MWSNKIYGCIGNIGNLELIQETNLDNRINYINRIRSEKEKVIQVEANLLKEFNQAHSQIIDLTTLPSYKLAFQSNNNDEYTINQNNINCGKRLYNVIEHVDILNIDPIEYSNFNSNNNVIEVISKNRKKLLASINLSAPENDKYKQRYDYSYKDKQISPQKSQEINQLYSRIERDLQEISLFNNEQDDKTHLISKFKQMINNKTISDNECLKYLESMVYPEDFESPIRIYFKQKFKAESLTVNFSINNKINSVKFEFLQSPDDLLMKIFEIDESFLDRTTLPLLYDSKTNLQIDLSSIGKYIGCLDIANNTTIIIK